MNKSNKISIRDIAQALNVSTTTVSLVINNKAGNKVSQAVQNRILDYVQQVNYIPNNSAQSLRTGKSKTIVFMCENISDPFFSSIAKEMEQLAFAQSYKIFYCSTENNATQAKELISFFNQMNIDAFIITPPDQFESEIKDLLAQSKKVVMVFDRFYNNLQHNYVILNNKLNSSEGTNYLINQGGQEIAYIGLESQLSTLIDREVGYLEAIEQEGLTSHVFKLRFEDLEHESALTDFEQFLVSKPQLDSLFFATNSLALNGLKVIQKLKKTIPQDYSFLTFDDRDVFDLYKPSISVIKQPIEEHAASLVKNTLELIQNPNAKQPSQTILDAQLIKRNSTPDRSLVR